MVRRSVGLSVGPSGGPAVRPSVHPALFSIIESHGFSVWKIFLCQNTNLAMSDDEVVASFVPPRYLFLVISFFYDVSGSSPYERRLKLQPFFDGVDADGNGDGGGGGSALWFKTM